MRMTEIETDQLDDIVYRLKGCHALLCELCASAEIYATPEHALAGVRDLLNYIIRDLQTAVSNANNYSRREGQT